jgi:hypothetical protein
VNSIVARVVIGIVALLPCLIPLDGAPQEVPVFREPFLLKLHIDDEHYYEEKFGRVPYVLNNEVYLFAGETFGINVIVAQNQPSRISYQPNPAKADVQFKFAQEKSTNGFTMQLVIRNKLKRTLFLDGRMTVPSKKEIYETGILPVKPSLRNVESWPHPIVQLVLRNFRFSESDREN